MFINFFFELKQAKLPVSLKEYLMLMEAMDKRVVDSFDVNDFYYLSRSALVKDERYLDNIGIKTISPALSLSLIRLEEMNFLRISNKGDAENSYSFSKNISNKVISHMQRNNG